MITYLWLAAGGAIGTIARYWLGGMVDSSIGETFPFGTLAVNVIGSFIIGFLAALTGPDGRIMVPSDMRMFAMVGICGGFTTFSSFSLQTLNLARDGDFMRAGAYIMLSVALCLISVWLGYIAATAINNRSLT